MENLVKRYLLERAYNNHICQNRISDIKTANDLYEEVKNGRIIIDEADFDIWLHRLKENKRNFGRCLKMAGFLRPNEDITEITEHEDYSSIKDACVGNNRPKQIISMFGDDCCSRPNLQILKQPTHLVVNGVYDNLKIYLANLTRCPSSTFSIGYLGQINANSIHTIKMLNYYKKIKEYLEKYIGLSKLTVIDEPILGDSYVYILNYNIKTNKPKDKDVITTYSDR